MRPLLLLLLLLAGAGKLSAQSEAVPLPEGTRVRVVLQDPDSARLVGGLLRLDGSGVALSVAGQAERTLVWPAVRRVEVSRGKSLRRALLPGARWGAFVGAGLGGIAGALLSRELPTRPGQSALLGVLGGGALGSGVGAGAGAALSGERWEPYILVPAGWSPAPAGARKRAVPVTKDPPTSPRRDDGDPAGPPGR